MSMKKMENTVFAAADIALPPYDEKDPHWEQWAVIACDQFTSEPGYWQQVQTIVGDAPSAYWLMLPEAYLGTAQESRHQSRLSEAMSELNSWLTVREHSLIYLERTLPDGRIRRGLIGKLDLEAYDYRPGSAAFVRATEATVLERIPPRCAIRQEAVYEMPHVMAFYTDPRQRILQPVREALPSLRCLYRTELMLGGGSAAGYAVEGNLLETVLESVAQYEEERRNAGGIGYAIGDGNHSLAAAKAHYENQKKRLGESAKTDPSRYALVELVALEDEAIQFEPIYRLITGCDEDDLFAGLAAIARENVFSDQCVTAVTAKGKRIFSFCSPTHSLTVGTLQNFLDCYIQSHPQVSCDYIHGKESLLELAKAPGAIGFLFEGMRKEILFPYVESYGVLPRKTFSMGEARSKRYYIELRKIQK